MLMDIKTQIKVPPPAPSYSSMGKTSDATSKLGNALSKKASKRTDGVDCGQRRGVKKSGKNWEGLDLIDNILAEVNKRHGKKNPRGETLLSSPRVSPAIVERDASEGADVLMRTFVKDTAMKMDHPTLKSMPAAKLVLQQESRVELEDELDPDETQYTVIKRRKEKAKKQIPTAAFMAPDRPHPGQELLNRGPSVGKYTPHFGVVERKHVGVTIATGLRVMGEDQNTSSMNLTNGSKSPDRARSPDGDGNTFELTQARGERPAVSFPESKRKEGLEDKPGSAGGAAEADKADKNGAATTGDKKVAAAAGPPLEPEPYRKHAVRDCSSAFKSVGRKEEKSHTTDADYWPFPQPGPTHYAQGRMTPGTRITVADPMPGCGANTMYSVDDKHRPKSVISFDRAISRDKANARTQSGATPHMLNYVVNQDTLSTMSRRGKGATSFKYQQGRPHTVTPTSGLNTEPLGLYHGSIATNPKKGYVNLARNSRANGRDDSIFEAVSDEKRPLTVDASLVERRAASVTFSRAEKKSVLGSSRVDETEYHPNYASVSRRRPMASMGGTTRDAPVIGEKPRGVGHAERELDTAKFDRARHVTTPVMGSQLSRDARNKVLSPAMHASDVVYDIPAPKPNAITFSRLKRP